MIVVKLGGSLYDSPELKCWLQTLADISETISIVIVPGGGPFADQVRKAQKQHHFNDTTAHHMALVAMKQFGLMLNGLEAKCQPFIDPEGSQGLSVWLPDDSLLTEPSILHSWDLTSDSLALWLASKLDAEKLFLVKHRDVASASIEQLTADNVIDRHFSVLFSQFSIQTQIVHYQSFSDFSHTISHQNNKTALYLP